MRDEGLIALFWEGYQAGNGWMLFDGPPTVLEYFRWLLDTKAEEFGLEDQEVQVLRGVLEKAEWAVASSHVAEHHHEDFLDSANHFIRKFDEAQWGKYDASGHTFYDYRRLVTDRAFTEEFHQYRADQELAPVSPADALDDFEEMLGRIPGPGSWAP